MYFVTMYLVSMAIMQWGEIFERVHFMLSEYRISLNKVRTLENLTSSDGDII